MMCASIYGMQQIHVTQLKDSEIIIQYKYIHIYIYNINIYIFILYCYNNTIEIIIEIYQIYNKQLPYT